MKLFTLGTALLMSAALATSASAQTYPAKPIQIIVPYAPGGVTDVLARALAQRLGDAWGQQAVVLNRPGGNSQVGTEQAAKAPADGYTLLVTSDTTFTANPYLYSKLKYSADDFIPISGLGLSPQALVVHPSVPAKNLDELTALAKSSPDKLFYGTFGIGSSGHLNILNLEKRTGTQYTPVHYSGASPAITDLLGGHIKIMIVSIGLIAQHWNSGNLKVLAFGSEKRLERHPDMPVLNETLKGFDAGSWYGLFVQKGTPPDIVAKISTETQRIFNDAAFQNQFLTPSYTYSIASTPEVFAERIRREKEMFGELIRSTNVSAD
jgi:tripartite-type tricarboxylate transporter receptor subunit TctC